MIIELTENKLEEAKNSFLSIDEVKQEFKNNPFARYLILKEKDELLGYLYYSDIYERAEINQFEIKKSNIQCDTAYRNNHTRKLSGSIEKLDKASGRFQLYICTCRFTRNNGKTRACKVQSKYI